MNRFGCLFMPAIVSGAQLPGNAPLIARLELLLEVAAGLLFAVGDFAECFGGCGNAGNKEVHFCRVPKEHCDGFELCSDGFEAL